jgi:hypothetical protein
VRVRRIRIDDRLPRLGADVEQVLVGRVQLRSWVRLRADSLLRPGFALDAIEFGRDAVGQRE